MWDLNSILPGSVGEPDASAKLKLICAHLLYSVSRPEEAPNMKDVHRSDWLHKR
jgi:hypothetical protein